MNPHSESFIFHICNKSIANFNIFASEEDADRFMSTLDFYRQSQPYSLSEGVKRNSYRYSNLLIYTPESTVKYISYCIMPDHYHILIKVSDPNLLSQFVANVQNSYTRYFNLKHKRKGPLWQSRYRRVLIESNEQLLHTSRYLHINPTTSRLTPRPELWRYSSYNDIITDSTYLKIYLTEISIRKSDIYKKFVEDRIDYQQTLRHIKKFLLE